MTKAQKKESIQLYGWIALAWFLLWEFSILVTNPSTFFQRTVNELWRDAYLVTLNFFFFEYVVTYIFGKRPGIFSRILLGIFLAWIMLMLYSFGLFTWRLFGIGLGIYKSFLADASVSHALAVQMQASVASVFFFGIIRHIYYYRKLKETAQKLRIENQEAELNFLKSQTNPHFLFNTLNNIYSLARDKSDLAPESILRLSKILRFMLYEAGGEYITIEQEVAIINDYIALEKLRVTK